jgi:hypothetical protein
MCKDLIQEFDYKDHNKDFIEYIDGFGYMEYIDYRIYIPDMYGRNAIYEYRRKTSKI